jgi:heat shock protein HslJ
MGMRKRRSALASTMMALGLLAAPAPGIAAEAGKGPYQPPRFENYRWIILSYYDGRALIDSKASSSIAFVNGRIQGAGSCGPFGGEYYVSGGNVRIHAETVLSDGPCFQVNLKEAQAILDALNTGERRIEQRADRLVLRDTAGAVQVVLTPGQ